MPFSIIAAISANNVIGKDSKLPWDIPEDLEHFYNVVADKVVVMGRKTYNSIGKAIKGSENIVLSKNRSLQLPDCIVLHSVEEVLKLYGDSKQEIMIIGGTEIYRRFLPLVSKIYLTFIHADIDGDVYFPQWDKKQWRVVDMRDSKNREYSYSFVVLDLTPNTL
jgi:dihydrofolate reductase